MIFQPRVVRDYTNFKQDNEQVVALGNFDGIHLGHQYIINLTCEIAKSKNLECGLITFEPHPAKTLANLSHFRIYDVNQKISILQQFALNKIFLMDFTKEFSLISAYNFFTKILIEKLKVNHIVVGEDFVFGHNRVGDAEFLQELTSKYNIGLTQIKRQSVGEENCSSSKIRKYIREGDFLNASKLLGRNYQLTARISNNKLILGDVCIPKDGTYPAKIIVDNKIYNVTTKIVDNNINILSQDLSNIKEEVILEYEMDI